MKGNPGRRKPQQARNRFRAPRNRFMGCHRTSSAARRRQQGENRAIRNRRNRFRNRFRNRLFGPKTP